MIKTKFTNFIDFLYPNCLHARMINFSNSKMKEYFETDLKEMFRKFLDI